MSVITVSAVIFRREDGAVLTVRKRGTYAFMLPGGKPEAGESAADCARREVAEELGVEVSPEHLSHFGDFVSTAANEANHALHANVFVAHVLVDPEPHAELDEVRWVHPETGIDDEREAPLNRDHVFPLLLGSPKAPECAQTASLARQSGGYCACCDA